MISFGRRDSLPSLETYLASVGIAAAGACGDRVTFGWDDELPSLEAETTSADTSGGDARKDQMPFPLQKAFHI